jgi:UDP-N-acetyl-D-mannosaminuronate dehydrogenase
MKNKKSNLCIGLGQIGSAIQSVLECDGIDKGLHEPKHYKVIHICIPFTEDFIEQVKEYQKLFTPEFTVIHSTVTVGTSEQVGAIYSPCRGKHPNLKEGILTFEKLFAGKGAEIVAEIFKEKGVKTKCIPDTKTAEAFKLWDTTQYGFNIILEKEIHKYCKDNDLDFDVVYTWGNETYNEGYEKLGHPEYKKYVLKHTEGKIGGHCVVQNTPLLEGNIPKLIQEYNDRI